MKRCFKCQRELPETEFYRHPQMADGHLGKCKDCVRADVTRNRHEHVEQYRAYDRRRAATVERADQRARVSREWRLRYPERRAAQRAAGRQIRTAPDRCEGCGEDKRLERHHPDYSQPLLVQWLCKPCHWIADERRRQADIDTDFREVPGTRSYDRQRWQDKGYDE